MNWIFGDNINTDLITPGRYNATTDPRELAGIAFVEYRPEFAKRVKNGDFIIAGENFGCGSSRETAAIALKHCGIAAIIAKSYARIFFRNCLNVGLLAIVANTKRIEKDDALALDLIRSKLINKTKKTTQDVAIPEFMIKLHKVGGIIPYIQKKGLGALAEFQQL